MQAGCLGNVGKMVAVVSEQSITGALAAAGVLSLHVDRALRVRRVIEQIHVEVAVSVIVEEQRLGRIADVLKSEFLGPVSERAVTVVDVEHVTPVHREVIDARDIDVDFPIAVDVGHRDAGFPADRIGDAGLVGDVLELIVALIAIELVRTEVRGEVEVGEPVSVDIADGHSCTVVVVQVVQDVEVGPLGQVVRESDAGRLGLQQLEECVSWRGYGALTTDKHNRANHSHPGDHKLQTACCPLPASRFPPQLPYLAGVKRIACPPPGAHTTLRFVLESTVLFEMLTGSGFVAQFAPGPSA